MTYNPPHFLDPKPFIERQEYLLHQTDMGRVPVIFSTPSFEPSPPPTSPHPKWYPPLHLFNSVELRWRKADGGDRAFEIRDEDETRTERSGPFRLVISHTSSGLARSMRSFSEVLEVTNTQMVFPLPTSASIRLRPFWPTPKPGGAIKPKRTSWHVDGIGRRLEGRLDGTAYLHAMIGADASQVPHSTYTYPDQSP